MGEEASATWDRKSIACRISGLSFMRDKEAPKGIQNHLKISKPDSSVRLGTRTFCVGSPNVDFSPYRRY